MGGYKSWKEKRADDLSIENEPGNWEYLDIGKYRDWYHLPTMLQYVAAAEKYGINPFDYVALGISESGLGNTDPGNPSRIYWSQHPSLTQMLSPTGMMPKEEDTRELSIDFGAKFLADKFRQYPNDRMKALQAYSGTGKTIYGGHPDVVQYQTGSTRSFGKPYQSINYWIDQPQAKRIAMIAEVIKALPELRGLFPEE